MFEKHYPNILQDCFIYKILLFLMSFTFHLTPVRSERQKSLLILVSTIWKNPVCFCKGKHRNERDRGTTLMRFYNQCHFDLCLWSLHQE